MDSLPRSASGRTGRRIRGPAGRGNPAYPHAEGGTPMRAAVYARVSTEAQRQRGTIGSQLQVLRQRVSDEADELVAEFCDDGHSGARLDRPGLDALRDAAEAGLIDLVWCLSPDRLPPLSAHPGLVPAQLA